MLRSLFLLPLLACFTTAAAREAQPAIVGRASVIDGDTLELRGSRIRIWGIDAPDTGYMPSLPCTGNTPY